MRWLILLALLITACGGDCPVLDGKQLAADGAAEMRCDASTGLEPFDHRAYYTLAVLDEDAALRGYVLVSAGGVGRPSGPVADNLTHRCTSSSPANGCASSATLECEPVETTEDPGPAGLAWLPMRVTLDVSVDPELDGASYAGVVTLASERCTATLDGALLSEQPLP